MVGYQGVIDAVAPLQSIERLADRLEADPVASPDAREPLEWRQLALAGVGVEELMDALSTLEHTMNVVLFTHRPELLRLADRVMSVVDGRVVS